MRTIKEMREKHWSGVKTIWPERRSKVAVRFCWEGFVMNTTGLELAQCFAKNGSWNEANYWLTSAYAHGEKNELFWRQFI